MSYLQDKKIQRKKTLVISFFIILLLIFFFFRSALFNGLSRFSSIIFHPIVVVGNGIGGKFSNVGSFFASKNSLMKENENLQNELSSNLATLANYNSILDDNASMKEMLGRKPGKANMILSAILAKPNQSLYDTLIIDAGANVGVVAGERVFALGNVPIGYIAEVDTYSSKVILFSNPGEKTNVIIPGNGKNIIVQVVGRGGGNFEMVLTKDVTVTAGTEVDLPGILDYPLATVATTVSDPRDSFTKALLASPVNVEELKFVEVEK